GPLLGCHQRADELDPFSDATREQMKERERERARERERVLSEEAFAALGSFGSDRERDRDTDRPNVMRPLTPSMRRAIIDADAASRRQSTHVLHYAVLPSALVQDPDTNRWETTGVHDVPDEHVFGTAEALLPSLFTSPIAPREVWRDLSCQPLIYV
ncbi:hypothetical protein KIPB_011489, partial [Kipferlia bialata]